MAIGSANLMVSFQFTPYQPLLAWQRNSMTIGYNSALVRDIFQIVAAAKRPWLGMWEASGVFPKMGSVLGPLWFVVVISHTGD